MASIGLLQRHCLFALVLVPTLAAHGFGADVACRWQGKVRACSA